MYLFLLLVGLLLTAAGVVAIVLGTPYDPLSLGSFGNTLIVAGAALLTGGLLLIGLAAVLRQLQGLTAALAEQPAKQPTRPVALASAKVAAVSKPANPPEVAVSRPAEPRASETRAPETRAPEPRPSDPPLQDEAAVAPPAEPHRPLAWMRGKPKPAPADEPAPAADVAPETPQPRSPPREEDLPAPEPAETKDWSPPSDRAKDSGLFDTSWPETKPGIAAAPAETGKRHPSRSDPPQRPRQGPAAAERPRPASQPVAILKSGVIDGMAYTLYADGSIEAELPQGTLSFASVEELREHLEKHGG